MKNPYEVLRVKELDIQRLKKEIEALRITARLLSGEDATAPSDEKTNVHQMAEMP